MPGNVSKLYIKEKCADGMTDLYRSIYIYMIAIGWLYFIFKIGLVYLLHII